MIGSKWKQKRGDILLLRNSLEKEIADETVGADDDNEIGDKFYRWIDNYSLW